MADRHNRYERAFEAYLQRLGVPYVAVDEARRARWPGGKTLKNLDFIVATGLSTGWLVDVKGRRFPTGRFHPQYWKNWSPEEDLHSLQKWENLFSPGYRGLFVFAYHIVGQRSPVPENYEFHFERERYGFIAIPFADYAAYARRLSPRWGTVMMPAGIFRQLARPFAALIAECWGFPDTSQACEATYAVDPAMLVPPLTEQG